VCSVHVGGRQGAEAEPLGMQPAGPCTCRTGVGWLQGVSMLCTRGSERCRAEWHDLAQPQPAITNRHCLQCLLTSNLVMPMEGRGGRTVGARTMIQVAGSLHSSEHERSAPVASCRLHLARCRLPAVTTARQQGPSPAQDVNGSANVNSMLSAYAGYRAGVPFIDSYPSSVLLFAAARLAAQTLLMRAPCAGSPRR
jgi:hypothetical protein